MMAASILSIVLTHINGASCDAEWLIVLWIAGGFGFVFTGTYDVRQNPAASRKDLKVVVKLPTTDPDAICTFQSEMELNKKLSSYGRLPGIAEFVGTVDLRPIERVLPSGLGSRTGLVWIAVQEKTLDTFFDRGGGMSPVLASTMGVKESPPTRTAQGEVVYIKVELCRRVLGESLLPLYVIHDKGIIHRDMKPKNIMVQRPSHPLLRPPPPSRTTQVAPPTSPPSLPPSPHILTLPLPPPPPCKHDPPP